ncbi:MAG TPA: ABC transporter permease [Streptosporangiaceae bacterium]|jgi:ribose transport system permease protein
MNDGMTNDARILSHEAGSEGDAQPTGRTATPATSNRRPSVARTALIALRRHGQMLSVFAIVLLLLAFLVPDFLTVQNVKAILEQGSILGVVSVGMVFVVLTGGIDLSVGSALALVSVIFAELANSGMPILAAVAIGVLAGAAFGFVNGIGIAYVRIQPFVMTLATLAIGAGLALMLANGGELPFNRNSGLLNFLGDGQVSGIPGEAIVLLGLALFGWVVTRYVPFGRSIYAIGGNRSTAFLSGIRVGRNLVAVYTIAGVCAGLGGVMTAAQLQSGEPTAGSLINLQAIAAVVIGGVSLFGGKGSIGGGVIGAFVLAIIADALVLKGVTPYTSEVLQGAVIIVAVLLTSGDLRDAIAKRLRALRKRERAADLSS